MSSETTSLQESTDSARAAVVLVNWNNSPDCIECLDTLLMQSYPSFEVFVVDNASSDDSVREIAEWCSKPNFRSGWRKFDGVDRWSDSHSGEAVACDVLSESQHRSTAFQHRRISIVRSQANGGFAAGCNLGIRCAIAVGCDFFWLLNTDTAVHRHALHHLVERIRSTTSTGMVGSTVCYYDRPSVVQALAGARLLSDRVSSWHIGEGTDVALAESSCADVEADLDYIFGASLLVSRSFVTEIGPMTEDYFLYFEEIDWAMRGRARFPLGYAFRSLVFHKSGSGSSKRLPLFTARFYYRNRIRFIARFFPDLLPKAKLTVWRDGMKAFAKGQWRLSLLIMRIAWSASAISREKFANRSPLL